MSGVVFPHGEMDGLMDGLMDGWLDKASYRVAYLQLNILIC